MENMGWGFKFQNLRHVFFAVSFRATLTGPCPPRGKELEIWATAGKIIEIDQYLSGELRKDLLSDRTREDGCFRGLRVYMRRWPTIYGTMRRFVVKTCCCPWPFGYGSIKAGYPK